ncbi:AbiV family abortive infection protein [Undibacterium sp. TC4M20W]|uniref:AbiV family abortive infection protein n=1 Tax=unclassified Undibacterium TaxID=2630295 RepID=UPI003BF0EB8E
MNVQASVEVFSGTAMAKVKTIKQNTLSVYKWKRLAKEALINALRLHKDAVLLFEAGSYPSAYQISVLALEEFAKAKWVDHYYYSSVTNDGFPDAEFEQSWLKLLYLHSEKQFAFISYDLFEFTPELVKFIKSGQLERKKQSAVYVGLGRGSKIIDVNSRISTPKSIKLIDAKRMISWVNAEFIYIHKSITVNSGNFGIADLDEVILWKANQFIFEWPYKSRIRSRNNRFAHLNAQTP